LSGPNDHYARVETVWPARIGACGEGVRVGGGEKVGQWSEREDIGVEVDEGGEEGVEAEVVEFCQSKVEIGAACL